MSIDFISNSKHNTDRIASANIPKAGKRGYISYVDRRYRGFRLVRYIPIDSLIELRLYYTQLSLRVGIDEITYVAR